MRLRNVLTVSVCVVGIAAVAVSKPVPIVLDILGFKEGRILFCQVTDGNLTKNINQDVPILWKRLRRAAIAIGSSEPPTYTVYLERGSSSAAQAIAISVATTGNGYVEYLGKKILFFKSTEFYDFCVTAFNNSEIELAPAPLSY